MNKWRFVLLTFIVFPLFTLGFAETHQNETATMKFGMQVVMTAQPGKGGELGELMLKASEIVAELDGCEIYIVQVSVADSDKILIAEVWESAEAHKASLANPAVLELIVKARPLIAEMEHHMAKPLGGKGL